MNECKPLHGGSGVKAKLLGVETLSNCTLTDEGIHASLRAGVPARLLEVLGTSAVGRCMLTQVDPRSASG
jgi:hypothetical protein